MANRWWTPAAAAVAVVLIGTGAAAWLGSGEDPPAAGAAPPARASEAAAVPRTDPADLLVRDGDRVAVSGLVVVRPGGQVRMCAPTAQPVPGPPVGREPLPGNCDLGVAVRGLDLTRMTDRQVLGGAVTGRARVEGTYRAGVVTVERQAPPDPEEAGSPQTPQQPPCPAPAGGWNPAPPDVQLLVTWLKAHQDRYVEPYVTYPDGRPGAGTTVAVVGTVLDPAVAERELRAAYAGNLCVVPAEHPGATLTAVAERIGTDGAAWSEHGVYAAGPDMVTGAVNVELVVLDAAAQRWLRQADDRTGTVAPRPWVRPLTPR